MIYSSGVAGRMASMAFYIPYLRMSSSTLHSYGAIRFNFDQTNNLTLDIMLDSINVLSGAN